MFPFRSSVKKIIKKGGEGKGGRRGRGRKETEWEEEEEEAEEKEGEEEEGEEANICMQLNFIQGHGVCTHGPYHPGADVLP